jgi:hypothetical protein
VAKALKPWHWPFLGVVAFCLLTMVALVPLTLERLGAYGPSPVGAWGNDSEGFTLIFEDNGKAILVDSASWVRNPRACQATYSRFKKRISLSHNAFLEFVVKDESLTLITPDRPLVFYRTTRRPQLPEHLDAWSPITLDPLVLLGRKVAP